MLLCVLIIISLDAFTQCNLVIMLLGHSLHTWLLSSLYTCACVSFMSSQTNVYQLFMNVMSNVVLPNLAYITSASTNWVDEGHTVCGYTDARRLFSCVLLVSQMYSSFALTTFQWGIWNCTTAQLLTDCIVIIDLIKITRSCTTIYLLNKRYAVCEFTVLVLHHSRWVN